MSDRHRTPSLAARLARTALRAAGGWRFVGDLPAPRRAVVLAAPHTHNLDGLLLVSLALSVDLPIAWMVKDSWSLGPFGPLVRRFGAVPVDRSGPGGMVAAMVDELSRRDDFYLVIPPEGTRARADAWKSGFYRIALGAGVPVVPSFLDYAHRQGSFGDPLTLTGDVRADMDRLRALYADKAWMARHPENYGPVRLREEDPNAAPTP